MKKLFKRYKQKIDNIFTFGILPVVAIIIGIGLIYKEFWTICFIISILLNLAFVFYFWEDFKDFFNQKKN